MSLCHSGGGPRIQVFRPTMEEMKDFSKYIAYMESQGANKAGIAKIIPPKEFCPRKNGYDDIGDVKIPAPIEQVVSGTGGLYQTYNIQQKPMTVREYKKLAESTRYKTPSHFDYADLIRKFWSNITFNPAIYGADISGSLYDPGVEEFNINHLGTILDLINEGYGVKIEGVNTAYLYFGMWKTTFAWHTEDMDLYSINYLHHGAPKTWYGIPPEHGRRLERLAAGFFHDIAKECPAFLRHKMSLISPKILQKFSIPFDSITQEEGEFMITFPFGYHAGFNHGFNSAESTNFALPRWVEYGKRASMCTCNQDNVKISMDIFVKTLQPDRYPLWLEGKDYGPHPEDPSRIYAAPPPITSPKSKKSETSTSNSSLISKRHPIFKKSLSSSEDDFAESYPKPSRKKKLKPSPPNNLPIIVINTKLQTAHVKKRGRKALQDKATVVDGKPFTIKDLNINITPIKMDKNIVDAAVLISSPPSLGITGSPSRDTMSPLPVDDDKSPIKLLSQALDLDHFKDDVKLTEAELNSSRHTSPKKEVEAPSSNASKAEQEEMEEDNQSLDLQDFASQWPVPLVSLWQHREPNLTAEQKFNMHLSAIYPHCAVCCVTSSSFQLRKFPLPRIKVPPCSPVKMPSHYFDPTLPSHVLTPENTSPLLVCEDCNITVHAACYGVLDPPTGSWQCSRCARHDDYAACSLCRLRGGALKACTDSRWAHIHCSLFFSEVFFENSLQKEPINITFMMVRKKMSCCYCQNVVKRGPKYRGGCIKCTDCDRTYHVSCGLAAGASFVLQAWPLPHRSTCTFSHQLPKIPQSQETLISLQGEEASSSSATPEDISSSSCTVDQEDILVLDVSSSLLETEILPSLESSPSPPCTMENECLLDSHEEKFAQEVELTLSSQVCDKSPSTLAHTSSSSPTIELLGS